MFDFQPQLRGKLVELRPMLAKDWEQLYAAASDPLIWELHPQRNRYEEAVFRVYFDEGMASGGALVVLDRASGAIIGSSRYSTKFSQPGEMEIGWTFLARSHWGGTYNREMKRLMLEHAFQCVDTVIFRIGEHNARSRRAVEKIGGLLTDRVLRTVVGENATTHVYYAITRERFQSSPLAQ